VSGGFGFPLGFATGTFVMVVAVAAGAAGHPGWSVAALAVAVAAVSAVTTFPAAVATAVVCWFLHDGFVLGRHGDLVFTTASEASAAILVAVAVAAWAMATLARIERRRQGEPVPPDIPAPRQAPGSAETPIDTVSFDEWGTW
jgi:hypothetical protein